VRRALSFELASAHEALHQHAEALEIYQTVGNEDPAFRDVAARVQKLGGRISQPIAAKSAVAAKSGPPPAATGKVPGAMRPAASGNTPTSSANTTTSSAAPSNEPEPPGAPRKNRKIGFV
jgi:hypothetical protein